MKKSKKIITGILVDTENGISRFELDQSGNSREKLQRIYDALKCDIIDIATRKFGEHYYDIYLDDEGTFKPLEEQVPTIIGFNKGECVEQIVGNVFIVKHDGEGGMQSLTDEEMREVISTQVVYEHPHLHKKKIAIGVTY